jgi:hypothetical protein
VWTLSTSLRIWRLGVRIPRGAPQSPQLSGPVTGSLTALRPPNCDQTATTSAGTPNLTATTCDHNRLFRVHSCCSAPPLPRQPVIDGRHCPAFRLDERTSSPVCTVTSIDGWVRVVTLVHYRTWRRPSTNTPGWRRAWAPVRSKTGVAGWIPAGFHQQGKPVCRKLGRRLLIEPSFEATAAR